MQSNQIKQRHVTTNDNFYHWIYRYIFEFECAAEDQGLLKHICMHWRYREE